MRKKHYIYCIVLLHFILGIHNGYVALWENDSRTPSAVFSVPAENLPPEDQRALAGGIRIEDNAALQRMLEDYLS